MDIPILVILAAKAATNQSHDRLRIVLRSPLDAQSKNLYDLYDGVRDLIVKHFLKPEERLDAQAREYGAWVPLAAHEIAPQPVFYDGVVGPVVIYEYMLGEVWNRRLPSADERSQLAELLLRHHA